MSIAVDFDQRIEGKWHCGGRLHQCVCGVETVENYGEPHTAFQQRRDMNHLVGREPNRVKDVGEAVIGKVIGFA